MSGEPTGAGDRVIRQPFGTLPDGAPVDLVRLIGARGFEARIMTYGAAIQSLFVPDRTGRLADVITGQDDLAGYVANRRYFGATVGRFANRIAGATFDLDGATFPLAANNGTNAIHGGLAGFDRKIWTIKELVDTPAPRLTLAYTSPDGEEGYPGTLATEVTYTVEGTTLTIDFTATTDRPTVVNLTNHSFFNLAGVAQGGSALDHVLTIPADRYIPVNAATVAIGGPEEVAGTPFDFRTPRAIGARIREVHEQLAVRHGYDHNYCLGERRADAPRLAARLADPASGRVMELHTDQPGVQFYAGNYLDGSVPGKYGRLHRQSDAICLEPQVWPDAPNRPDFPSARLDPGATYRHSSIYRFDVA
ncbi:aldose epimerase family protein [Ancylobacter terrae]|uniref:aldose epimerase family protein n=1 Tax=Ancylobacter sp. sgz301288 TaxID=3342077 RepID=UPI00385F20CC